MQRATKPVEFSVTQGRGIYRAAQSVYGRYPWYSVTSRGDVFHLYRPRHYETDAEIVVMLADELDREDPVVPRLRLVTTPTAPVSSVSVWPLWQHELGRGRARSRRRSVSGRSPG